MAFPPQSTYEGNGYRWGTYSGSTYDMSNASVASGINVTQLGYHRMGSRGYGGNFQELSFPLDTLNDAGIRGKYPQFWKPTNWKGSFGILHYLAKEGPNYNEGLHLRALTNGFRNYTTAIWAIQDIKRNASTGNYENVGTKGNAARTPFHARYDLEKKNTGI